jgi:hypothetical protein
VQLAEILITATFILLLSLWVWKGRFFKLIGISKKVLIIAFCLKVLAAAALCFYYDKSMPEDRDKADVFKYYDESKHISSKLSEPDVYFKIFLSIECDECKVQYEKMRHWYKPKKFGFANDSRTMIKLHALLSLISGGYYLPQVVLFAFLSFFGIIFMMKGLQKLRARSHLESFLLLLLLPSILFWTSAPLKECLFSLILGLVFYFFVSSKNGNLKSNLSLILIVFCTYFLKPQVGVLLVGTILFIGVLPRKLPLKKGQYFGLIALVFLVSVLSFPTIFKNLNQKKQQYDLEARGQAHIETANAIFLVSLDRIASSKLGDAIDFNADKQVYWLKKDKENWFKQNSDSTVHGRVIWINKAAKTHVRMDNYNDFLSWVRLTPTALRNVFIEPLPSSPLTILFFIENLFLIGLILIGVKNGNKWDSVSWLLIFAACLVLLYGTTVPVIGALLRYKSLIYLSLLLGVFGANDRAIISYFRAYD